MEVNSEKKSVDMWFQSLFMFLKPIVQELTGI